MGLKGESVSDSRVWITKSHHPFRIKGTVERRTNKTFLCVRHPLDTFPSYAALCNTASHGNKPDYDMAADYPEWWEWFIKRQADLQANFFETLIRKCTQEDNQPLYIVRYEDLVTAPKETLMGLMSFLLDEKDLAGTNVERRIEQVISKGSSAAQTYKLKSTTGQFDIHRSKYTPELLQYVQEKMEKHIYYFGYANVEDNPTGFFHFDEHTADNLALFNGFRRDTATTLDKILAPGYEPRYFSHNAGE